MIIKQQAKPFILLTQEGSSSRTSSSESESESLCVLFLLPELSAMV
jgi:hypothetical protein